MKEATARIKINRLLEAAGWRFFADAKGPANIELQTRVRAKMSDLDALGKNFEKAKRGFIYFLLLSEQLLPFIVLGAKAEEKSPLAGKERVRNYAKSQNCRFVILSNGNLHYFWDLDGASPYVITVFPTLSFVTDCQNAALDPRQLTEMVLGEQGMKIDSMFYEKFEETMRESDFIASGVAAGEWDRIIDYVQRELFDKPTEFYNLKKLRQAAAVDRCLGLREILEKIFGLIPGFKSKDDLLEEEFSKFIADYKIDEVEAILELKTYFKAYASSDQIRCIIESGQLTDLATMPAFTTKDFRAVPAKYRTLIPQYIKENVSLKIFAI